MKNKKSPVHGEATTNKGYNEKNPFQPQGAFTPDAADAAIPEERSTKKHLRDAPKKVADAVKKKDQRDLNEPDI